MIFGGFLIRRGSVSITIGAVYIAPERLVCPVVFARLKKLEREPGRSKSDGVQFAS